MVLIVCEHWGDGGCGGCKFVAVEEDKGIVRLLCAGCGKQMEVLYNEFYVEGAVRQSKGVEEKV